MHKLIKIAAAVMIGVGVAAAAFSVNSKLKPKQEAPNTHALASVLAQTVMASPAINAILAAKGKQGEFALCAFGVISYRLELASAEEMGETVECLDNAKDRAEALSCFPETAERAEAACMSVISGAVSY